jgi:signal transduction histidine kinase
LIPLHILRPKRPRHFPDVSDAPERRERVIATGRVYLAGGGLLSAHWGLLGPAQDVALITALLVGYLVLSVVLWASLRWKPTADPSIQIGAHAADLFCTTALTVLSWGPGSPFFLFFVFVLLAAAYRWGFRGTILTAAAGVSLLAGEAYVLTPASLPARLLRDIGLSPGRKFFEVHLLVLRCAYLLMVGLLLGYLAEGEKSLQSEAAATAQILGRTQAGGGLKAAIEGMLDGLLTVFGVLRATLCAEQIESGRMFLWEARRPLRGGRVKVQVREVERKQQDAYRPRAETDAWFAWKTRSGSHRIAALGRTKSQPGAPEAPEELPVALRESSVVLAAPFRLGGHWKGWVYVFDVSTPFNWKKQLRFLRSIVEAAAPAIYNSYLLSRMRSQIGARERGRVARELHDGAIQSLLAAELEMHVLRREGAAGAAAVAPGALDRVESLIHDQVLNLRELMEKIRPIELDPRRLPEFVAEQVEKFQRETGIEASFAGDGEPVRLTGRACRELIRIVQELLFNVRRHSGAGRVEVRLCARNGFCRLEVADDGRGFDFAGRFDQEALESMRKGPQVVQERLRTLGGSLTIESTPGKGARLEITVPQRKE